MSTCLALLLATGSARADARTDARRAFKAGMELIEQGQFDAGIAELRRANDILPHPNVIFNIAKAQEDAGKLEAALASYEEYLASDPGDRAAVEKRVQELRDEIAAAKAKPPPKPTPPPDTGPDGPDEPTTDPDLPPDPAPIAPPPPATELEDKGDEIYEETVVTATRGESSPLDSPNSTTIITRQDIRLSGITRIPELLRRVAGMDVMQITGGDANVSMRGFNGRLSNKVLVLVDGRTVQNDVLGSTFWEALTIDVDQIERIEVVRGPGSALYGANAFMGVINIITIPPGEPRGGARVGAGDGQQLYGSIWASGREEGFSYRASGGYTRYPRWTREVGDDRVDLQPLGDQTLAAENARVDIRTSQRITEGLYADLGGGFARSDLEIYGIGPFNDLVGTFESADLTGQVRTDFLRVRVYYARFETDVIANSGYLGRTLFPTNPRQNVVDNEVAFNYDFDTGPIEHRFNAGINYRYKDVAWNFLRDDTPDEHHGAVYLQDAAWFTEWLGAVLSGRLDYVPYLEGIVASPRGTIIVKPTPRQAVRVSGSTAFRSPTYLESYLELPVELQLPGLQQISSSARPEEEDALEPEQIISAEASYLNQESDFFEFELNGYYNRVSDLIVLADSRRATLSDKAAGAGGFDPSTGRYTVAFGGWENECDIFHVVGGEVGARAYPITGLDVFANYALNVGSQELPDGCEVIEDDRTSRHKFNVGVQGRTQVGISGELTFHYQSEQTWRERVITATGIEDRLFDLPGYTLLNARLGYRFYEDRVEVSGTVFNALADAFGDAPQMHPFGNRVGRRFMGFLEYNL